MKKEMIDQQHKVCERYGTSFFDSPDDQKIGISLNSKDHIYPLNGMRHNPENGTTGWYIWAGRGEPSKEDDFFKPLHVSHLAEWCPEILPFLGLPPGWRFLIAPNYEDVWFDEKLILMDT
jgi:hypothetical protein